MGDIPSHESKGPDAGRLEQAGWGLLRAGNARGAMREFRAALAIDANSPNALTGLAQSHLSLAEYSQARDVATELVRVSPEQSVSHRLLASAERRLLNPEAALTHAREALRLDPHEPISYHVMGNVLFDMRRFSEALDIVREGRKAAGYSAILAAQEASILLQKNGGKAAEPHVLEAMRMAPDDEYVLGVAARVMLARGDLAEARELTTRILKYNANNEDAISIYLLSDPRKYALLRAHERFPYWRREHGVMGWAASAAITIVVLAIAVVVILGTHVPGLVLGFGYRWFWMWQYKGHRAEVKEHFAQPVLKPGF